MRYLIRGTLIKIKINNLFKNHSTELTDIQKGTDVKGSGILRSSMDKKPLGSLIRPWG